MTTPIIPSPAPPVAPLESARGARAMAERACRALAVVALTAAAWMAWRDGRGTSATAGAPSRRLLTLDRAAVRDANGQGAVAAMHSALLASAGDTLEVQLREMPTRPARAALAAVAGAARPLAFWVDSTASAGVALSVAEIPGPRGGFDVRAASGGSGRVTLRDAGGVLDSLEGAPRQVHAWRVSGDARRVYLDAGSAQAVVDLRAVGSTKRLFVYGEPGWESKFVVAALEELGWQVDGTVRVSPSGRVTVGVPGRLDTARYAAVLVLDSTAVDARAITAFVNAGGGVVLSGDALRLPALAPLRPATASEVRGGIAGALLSETPRRGLEAWELTPVRGATVLQDDRGDHAHPEPAVVARRVGAGRVVATAYRESWRWRMQGSEDGMSDHRQWWRDVLQAALPTALPNSLPALRAVPVGAAQEAWPGDAAPYADLAARAGAPSVAQPRPAGRVGSPVPSHWPRWLFALATVALLVEWSSRRLRGLR